MQRTTNITFGDTVRLLSTPETEAVGVAGQVGKVYGETTPSASGVKVVGELVGDYALNVHFEGRKDTLCSRHTCLSILITVPEERFVSMAFRRSGRERQAVSGLSHR